MESKNLKKVSIFVDGPNYFKSAGRRFHVDFGRFKEYIEERYGKIVKFRWYDLEPEILPIDFDRTSYSKLERIINSSADEEVQLSKLRKDPKALLQLINSYKTMVRTKGMYEAKKSFLSYVRNIGEVILGKCSVYENREECPNCGIKFISTGKTEGGITDFNLGVDLIYYSARDISDIFVLVSGDSHFLRALRYVSEFGKKIVVFSFQDTTSFELKNNPIIEYHSFESIKKEVEKES